jgi:hypothetical protein
MFPAVKNRKRLTIQTYYDIGLGCLHKRHSHWRGVDTVAHHYVARPDGDSPQGFASFNPSQLEEIALQIR